MELALLSSVTHLELLTAQRVAANADSSSSEVFVWSVSRLLFGPLSILGEMKVGGLCRSVAATTHISSFHSVCVFFFLFLDCEYAQSLALRLK